MTKQIVSQTAVLSIKRLAGHPKGEKHLYDIPLCYDDQYGLHIKVPKGVIIGTKTAISVLLKTQYSDGTTELQPGVRFQGLNERG